MAQRIIFPGRDSLIAVHFIFRANFTDGILSTPPSLPSTALWQCHGFIYPDNDRVTLIGNTLVEEIDRKATETIVTSNRIT